LWRIREGDYVVDEKREYSLEDYCKEFGWGFTPLKDKHLVDNSNPKMFVYTIHFDDGVRQFISPYFNDYEHRSKYLQIDDEIFRQAKEEYKKRFDNKPIKIKKPFLQTKNTMTIVASNDRFVYTLLSFLLTYNKN
jgi:hypothetical protein